MTSLAAWVAGARPRTLPAAVVPVAVGTAVAAADGVIWWRAGAALVVSLALQVGTNYANDYSDGIRGTDADERRVGPVRLVGQGLARPKAVKLAAFGKSVNVTIGLPIVRTSVDHGTAFDIARRGVADEGSLVEAIVLAARLAKTSNVELRTSEPRTSEPEPRNPRTSEPGTQ